MVNSIEYTIYLIGTVVCLAWGALAALVYFFGKK